MNVSPRRRNPPLPRLTNSRVTSQSRVRFCSIPTSLIVTAGLSLERDRAVEQFSDNQGLGLALLEPAQVDQAADHHLFGVERMHPADGQEYPASGRYLDDHAEHARRLGPGEQRDHEVADLAHLITVGIEDGHSRQSRHEDAGRRSAHSANLSAKRCISGLLFAVPHHGVCPIPPFDCPGPGTPLSGGRRRGGLDIGTHDRRLHRAGAGHRVLAQHPGCGRDGAVPVRPRIRAVPRPDPCGNGCG